MKRMDICLCTDNNYVPYMGASIASIIKNQDDDSEIYFHIIDFDITNENKEKILSLKNIKNFNIEYYTPDIKTFELAFNKISSKQHFSPAMFGRLNIPSLLPNIDKILYIDCDIIIVGNLKELFNMDISNYHAMVLDHPNNSDEDLKRLHSMIGLNENDIYFCSGFMLINNKLWIENSIEEEFFKCLKNKNIFYFGDQDILQLTLQNKLKILSEKYAFFSYKDYHSKDKLPERKDLIGIHYLTGYKPWKGYCPDVFFVDEFWKYFMMTPWFKENIYKYTKIIATQEFYLTQNKLNNMIDKLAWWIPVKKWRDTFKDKVKSLFIMILYFK